MYPRSGSIARSFLCPVLILFSSLFLVSCFFLYDVPQLALSSSVELDNGRSSRAREDNYVKQVSGDEDAAADPPLEKLRLLLGLQGTPTSQHARTPLSAHPVPSPQLAPVPAPSHHPAFPPNRGPNRHGAHPPFPYPGFAPFLHDGGPEESHLSGWDRAKKKLLLAVLVSASATSAAFCLAFSVLCCRARRRQKMRDVRKEDLPATVSATRWGAGDTTRDSAANGYGVRYFPPVYEQFRVDALEMRAQQLNVGDNRQVCFSSRKVLAPWATASSATPTSAGAGNTTIKSEPTLGLAGETCSPPQTGAAPRLNVHPRVDSENANGNESSDGEGSFHSCCYSPCSIAKSSDQTEQARLAGSSPANSPPLKEALPGSSQDNGIPRPPGSNGFRLTSITEDTPCSTMMTNVPTPPPPPPPPRNRSFRKPNVKKGGSLPTSYSESRTTFSPALQPNSMPQLPLPLSVPPPPPPPPPPPAMKRATPDTVNGYSGALPPIPQPCNTMPVGKDGSVLPKLKPLHWDKVRAAPDQSMVWNKIRSSSFELDEVMIESLFGYASLGTGRAEEAMISRSTTPSKHVLEAQRVQNFTILLKALNATADQVCDALMRGTGLCAQQLEALIKMAPTEEEEKLLLAGRNSGEGGLQISEQLDPAERFVAGLLRMPLAFPKFEVMLFRETFSDEVDHIRTSFQTLEEACTELRSSRLFMRLLETVLRTGNRMNVGTMRGGARAFRLDALLKLADVKGTDGKTTLLHFVIHEIVRSETETEEGHGTDRQEEENLTKLQLDRPRNSNKGLDAAAAQLELVAGLSTELRQVKKTAGIDLDTLVCSVSNLAAEVGKLRHLLTDPAILAGGEEHQTFARSMEAFANAAKDVIRDLEQEEARVLRSVREVTEYFHGDSTASRDVTANPLCLFVIVRDFLTLLDRACKEIAAGGSKSYNGPGHSSPTLCGARKVMF